MTPDNIALVQDNIGMTYRELSLKANRIANYLLNQYDGRGENIVGVLQQQSIQMIVSIMGILKAGFAFLPLDPSLPEQSLKSMIDDAKVRVIITDKYNIRLVNRLQWECESAAVFLCPESSDIYMEEEETPGLLMDKKLWDYVGEEAENAIGMGGWKSSFTGRLFSRDEINEYRNNVREKLKPYIGKSTRILEIGCSSGFTMFELAPLAGFYYGTDISDKILERTRKQALDDGHKNIKLKALAAHDIDRLDEKDFDIIVFNSVVQAFKGHNYFRRVIKKCVGLLKENGIVFVGDVMDESTKSDLIDALKSFEKENRKSGYITKTAFTEELFLDRRFFDDLLMEQDGIKGCEFSGKIHTIKNEMTEYRYDAILFIDKKKPGRMGEQCSAAERPASGTSVNKKLKAKYQHDLKELNKYTDLKVINKPKPDDPAYVIFTSGSTGRPKGVVVLHRALYNMCCWYVNCHSITAEDRTTKFASCGFDASIMEIFPILIRGGSLYILSPEVKSDLNRLNKFLEDNKITVSFLPTQYCEQFMELPNNSLRILNTGGEKIRKYIKRNYKLVDNYGPTECTVVSSYYIVDKQTANIPIGKTVSNTRIYILDEYKRPVPEGQPGEMYISGENLAAGYLGNPLLTDERFLKDPFIEGERMYKTGDMARMLPDGNIEFLGRMDNQVKIRGYRIEPEEIELRLIEHPDIKEAVVTAYENAAREKALSAYIVAFRDITEEEINEYLKSAVPHYMIPEKYRFMDSFPLMPSGKVNRKALPEPDDNSGSHINFKAPESETQKKLCEIWKTVLGTKRIGIYDNFFDLGGHSLKVLKAALLIDREFGVELSASRLFKAATLKEQAELIENSESVEYIPIPETEKKEYYPTSAVQKGIYAIQQMDPLNTAYNIPFPFFIKGEVNKEKLNRAFNLVAKKHEAFRTGFTVFEGTVVQKIQDEVDIRIDYEEDSGEILDIRLDRYIKPFDLSTAPLLRICLIKLKPLEYLLFMDIHHIIMDGSSMEVLISDLSKAYNGGDIGTLKVQYRDFAFWQQNMLIKGSFDKQREYWSDKLSGDLPVLSLPLDYKRPPIRNFEGDVHRFEIGTGITLKLIDLAKRHGVSMNMLLLSIYKILLSKYSGSEDIIVGTPVYGRKFLDLKDIIGMFANTLALRSYPAGNKPFNHYLMEIKDVTIKAIDNQYYPYEELLGILDTRYEKSRNPIFDTMFVTQKFEDEALLLDGPGCMGEQCSAAERPALETKKLNASNRKSKFDLTWFAYFNENRITFDIEYSTSLFRRDTVINATKHYMRIVEQIIEKPSMLVSEIEIITEGEKKLILDGFNCKKSCMESVETVHGLFEDAAEKNKGKTALVYNGLSMSYSELNKRANQLAAYLRKKGVRRETVVALIASRSFEMVIGLLGILKAGGAVLPVNPGYPSDYINEILKDSGSRYIVKHLDGENDANTVFSQGLSNFETIDLNFKEINNEKCENLKPVNQPGDLLYIIYTSGTTGKPKGVMLEHRNLINLINYQRNETDIDFDCVLQFASIGFDVSFQEIFSCLLSGGKLLLISDKDRTDVLKLLGLIEKEKLTTLFLPPAFLELLFNEQEYIKDFPGSVRHIVSAGDRLYISKSLRDYIKKTGTTLHNHYGPSETHVVTALSIDPAREISDFPSIGKPITGRAIYIMNKHQKLMPPGISGELHIGGENLGRGYRGNTKLTEEKFVPDPFNPKQKIYKSGDMARWLPDGSIEFLGRIDRQVKIRGYRIEPAEIEKALEICDKVKKAAVVPFDGKEGRCLCAYVVSEDGVTEGNLKSFLSKRLPAFMIPAHFVSVSDIPVNYNGKVDIKALPEPHKTAPNGKGYDNGLPSDNTEKKLLEIWREVLESSEIGVNDDFFELGGHSLKAIKLMHRIKTAFKRELPVSTILNYPTVKKISRLLRSSSFEKKWSHMVEIKRNEGAKNIFCVHPAPGTVICYYDLAGNMDKNWSVYALQAKGLEKGQRPHGSLEEMAADYIKEIRGIQPEGPYNLLGWCIGGKIAYEIAQQLLNLGEEVEFLALLDTDPVFLRKPTIFPKMTPWFIYAILAMFSHSKTVYKNFDISSFGPYSLFCRIRTWSSIASAIVKYIPQKYKGRGRVVLFQTDEGEKIEQKIKDKSRSVRNFIENLEIIHVDGKHISIINNELLRIEL